MADWFNTEWRYSLPRDMIDGDELSGRIKAYRDLKLPELRIPLKKTDPQPEKPMLVFGDELEIQYPSFSPPPKVIWGGKAAMMLAFGEETPSVRDWLADPA
jgi:hypothetical protein